MRPTPTLLAGYLLLGLVPLLVSHPDLPGLGVAAVHVALALLFVRHARDSEPSRITLMDWLPLALVPALYAELPLLNQWAGEGFHDPVVQGWEHAVFGGDPAAAWAGRWPWMPFSEILHLGYLSFYPLIYLPQLPHQLRGRTRAFHVTGLAVMGGLVFCYAVFVLFPVQGPRYLWPAPAGIPDGPFRSLSLSLLEAGSSRGAAFPSSHVAVAAAQAFLGMRFYGWKKDSALVVLGAALAAGAVYGGFHYGVDVLVGAVVGVAAAVLALRLIPAEETREDEDAVRIPG